MKRGNLLWLSGLIALGAWIWLRDLSWLAQASDTLPILAALPLFVWLGSPWRLREPLPAARGGSLVAAGVLLAAGALGDLTLLMALGWTLLLWIWLSAQIDPARLGAVRRLMLPPLAFPWIANEGQPLAWWFRLSAAATAQSVFSAAGLHVTRTGTNLLVQGTPIAVAPACAGLGTLQAMLMAGCALAFIYFGRDGGPRYWLSLPALLVMSWLANTVRVIAITVVAVSFGPNFAAGTFHALGGLVVVLAMFGVCCAAFTLLRRLSAASSGNAA
jgi:exosortase/archaeosortase family protein